MHSPVGMGWVVMPGSRWMWAPELPPEEELKHRHPGAGGFG
jgi:hypothetical protein